MAGKGGKKRKLADARAETGSAESPQERKRAKDADGEKRKGPPLDENGQPRQRTDVRVHAKPNPAFEKFYRANLIDTGLLTEAGWATFVAAMAKPLPTTFWITPTDANAAHVKETLQEYRRKAEAGSGDVVVKPIPWVADDAAWFIDAPRAVLRKDPTFAKLHKFLIHHTEKGVISRQEEASMVPSYVLDITTGSRCLDMCAAPGSKTAQMLSQLATENFKAHGRGFPAEEGEANQLLGRIDYSEEEGVVVANDLSSDRVDKLVHQIKRLKKLYPLAVFTSHDARYFPTLRDDAGVAKPFTKILCDVMCSGDGTLRKAPHMWRHWDAKESIKLHPMQVQIALRATRLLAVGGRLVYSTCSLSPIENEAAVAHILKRTPGTLRLLDARKLISITSSPGTPTWKVMDPKTGEMYATLAEAKAAGSEGLRSYHFPPTDPKVAEEMKKCLRLLPGEQGDYGGFFVAVFEKMAELPRKRDRPAATDGEEAADVEEYDSDADGDVELAERQTQLAKYRANVDKAINDIEKAKAQAKLARVLGGGDLAREVARYTQLPEKFPGVLKGLVESYGLAKEFPVNQLLCRHHLELKEDGTLHQPHEGVPNRTLFLSKAAADVVRWGTGAHNQRPWRIVSGGLRFLVRDRFEAKQAKLREEAGEDVGSQGKFDSRFAQEAVELVRPYVSKRIVVIDDFSDTVKMLTRADKSIAVEGFKSAASQEAVKAIPGGGCVIRLMTADGRHVYVSGLRTKHALNVYVDNNEIDELRKICGVETPEKAPAADPEPEADA